MAPPTGIMIGKKWKVGKKIGTGACAVVCDLQTTDGDATTYAVKLARIPERTTKNGKSKGEMDISLLNYEQMIYQTQFQDLQGSMIPMLPASGPPVTGESEGE
jgi:hypothetical protein